jgi:hypothetical protein
MTNRFRRFFTIHCIVIISILACLLFSGPFPLLADDENFYKEDVNGDGQVTLADALHLLFRGRGSQISPRADYNGDGRFSVSDVVGMVSNIINGNLTLMQGDPFQLDIRQHPRLILSGMELEELRAKVLTTRKEVFDKIIEDVDNYQAADVNIVNKSTLNVRLRKTAFAYLMTGDSNYLYVGKIYLRTAAAYYRDLAASVDTGNWEVVGYRRTVAFAYDWLYSGLSESERSNIGQNIYRAGQYSSGGSSPYNGGGYGWFEASFYPTIALLYDGVNDNITKSWFNNSAGRIVDWKNVQLQVAADDGGVQSGMSYALYNYIRAPIFSFESWRSATGRDLLADHTYLKNFTVYWMYGLRPNGELSKIDDLQYVTQKIWPWHFKYLANRYNCPASKWLAENLEPMAYTRCWDVIWDTSDLPFEAEGPDETWPLARHFEGIGWVVMRSGWDEDATHAIFQSGNFYYGHQHADENAFTIFKKGSLAIDAGRYEWGSDHRSNYMARTIAHNTILVHDPDESFGDLVNDGGQTYPTSMPPAYQDLEDTEWDRGDISSFETNQWYSYACGDATNAYSNHKMKQYLRQFVHLQPDLFLVFDRVEATSADYNKYWLLHTMEEPEIEGTVARIAEREGRLLVRTILPEQATMNKVGGTGHEFDVFGNNFPPSGTHYSQQDGEEWGAWRLEVTPNEPAGEHFFLHLMLAGDTTLEQIPEATLERGDGWIKATFSYLEQDYSVSFATVGQAGGQIEITDRNGAIVLDQPLTDALQPQSGIGR